MGPPQASHERQVFVEIEIKDPPQLQVSNSLGLHLSSLFSAGETEAKGRKNFSSGHTRSWRKLGLGQGSFHYMAVIKHLHQTFIECLMYMLRRATLGYKQKPGLQSDLAFN